MALDGVPTITLNEALKLRTYDEVTINELITAPNTIHLGEVSLKNDFRKYLSLGDPDGGVLIDNTDGTLINLATVARDEAIVYGNYSTYSIMGFASTQPGTFI